MKISMRAYKKYIKNNFTFISFLDDDGNGVELDVTRETVVIHENIKSEDKINLQYVRSYKCYDFYVVAKNILKIALNRKFRRDFHFYISCKNGSWNILDKARKKDHEYYEKLSEGE